MLCSPACSCSIIARWTNVAKSRDSSILLFSAIVLTKSGSAPIAWPEVAFSRAAIAAALEVGREVQEVGFHAAGLRVVAGVGVNRQEQIRALAVGDRRALLQREELVGPPRQDDFDARRLLRAASRAAARRRARSPPPWCPRTTPPGSWPPCPGSITIRETPRPSCRAIEKPPAMFGCGGTTGAVVVAGGGGRRRRCRSRGSRRRSRRGRRTGRDRGSRRSCCRSPQPPACLPMPLSGTAAQARR